MAMSSFSRSFKSPSYLTPYRRPPMPGRTLSASSERSDDGSDPTTSGQTTPTWTQTHATYRRQGATSHPSSPGASMAGFTAAVGAATNMSESVPAGSRATDLSLFGSHTRPIAIEIPRIKKVKSGSVNTPPEPLSARGDLPGGYFPMHEDPKARIHRPHPFYSKARQDSQDFPFPSSPVAQLENPPAFQPPQNSTMTSHSSVPVASYFPAGYQETPLPMGKYYPSNYENNHSRPSSRSKSASVSIPQSSTSRVQPDIAVHSPPRAMNESEARKRQLQQYQRDMIVQASLAANELLSTSSSSKPRVPKLGSLPGKALSFGPPAIHKPTAPKLHPLGSPGPVTPMELETPCDKGYFESSQVNMNDKEQDNHSVYNQRPSGAGYTAHSM